MGIEPLALEGAVVVVTLGGGKEGTARELVGKRKRKREDELAHKPVRHSLWEQGSLEAHNELLFGCLDDEVEALQQRKAEYDEERRLSDGHMGVTPAGATHTVTLAVGQSSRWAVSPLHWRVLR